MSDNLREKAKDQLLHVGVAGTHAVVKSATIDELKSDK